MLNPVKLGISGGILWGFCMFICTILCNILWIFCKISKFNG